MPWNDIWKDMDRMHRRMNRFLDYWSEFEDDSEISDFPHRYRKAFTNFDETENEFVVKVEIPGVNKEDIHLDVTEKGIEIRAEKKQEKEIGKKDGKDYSYSKRFIGFYKSFNVPENADLNKIDASYKNGLLTVRIAKKTKSISKKKIEIREERK